MTRNKLRQIIRATAEAHSMTEADVYVRDQHKPLVTARHAAWVACKRAGANMTEIARIGGWDRTTVRHALEKAGAR